MKSTPDKWSRNKMLIFQISHIPLRCEEVEKDVEVRKRTYIENKMAEALIRTCYKCKRPYVKQVCKKSSKNFTSNVQWGSEYRISLVLKWLKVL